ncbi:MAG: hypothetical protein HRT35_35315, partial [Algicola sp.]|nr:hypothetical protein [Algicola sp.]
DNDSLYYLVTHNDVSQSQLWRLDLSTEQRTKLGRYPALDLMSRSHKLIYNFTAKKHVQLIGDIWSLDVQ